MWSPSGKGTMSQSDRRFTAPDKHVQPQIGIDDFLAIWGNELPEIDRCWNGVSGARYENYYCESWRLPEHWTDEATVKWKFNCHLLFVEAMKVQWSLMWLYCHFWQQRHLSIDCLYDCFRSYQFLERFKVDLTYRAAPHGVCGGVAVNHTAELSIPTNKVRILNVRQAIDRERHPKEPFSHWRPEHAESWPVQASTRTREKLESNMETP